MSAAVFQSAHGQKSKVCWGTLRLICTGQITPVLFGTWRLLPYTDLVTLNIGPAFNVIDSLFTKGQKVLGLRMFSWLLSVHPYFAAYCCLMAVLLIIRAEKNNESCMPEQSIDCFTSSGRNCQLCCSNHFLNAACSVVICSKQVIFSPNQSQLRFLVGE